MSALRLTWWASLAAIAVVALLAVSALGGLTPATPNSHPAAAGHGWPGWNWTAPAGPYTLNFTETGLPSGVAWSVTIVPVWNGSLPGPWSWGLSGHWWRGWESNRSVSPTVGFAVANGSYDFLVRDAWNNTTVYAPTPARGNVTVNGTNQTVEVAFAPVSYQTVTFTETGLPVATNWSVVLRSNETGGRWAPQPLCGGPSGPGGVLFNVSNGSSINFTVPNGGYRFEIAPAGNWSAVYLATPSEGNVSVDGADVTVDVTFAPLQLGNLSLVETGLPNGTFWSAAVHGAFWGPVAWNGSASDAVNFTLPDGSYNVTVSPAWAAGALYLPAPQWADVTIGASAVTVEITFTEQSGPAE
ncbi:MAG TPA: hypothetical protein VEL82_05355 [Thermoplasmata archaeon]|nr:hypothetical protein [Thermoplasmata archaeon]